ncbi:MAG: TRAP transporter small permease [Burkholderiales bacterium]|nr:MAG: TRAP transporter small permease [Burkholderiales bacterium]
MTGSNPSHESRRPPGDRLLAPLHRFAQISAWICGGLLTAVSVLVVIEVIGRNFFGLRQHGSDELAGYAFAITVAWGFGYCVLERSHIRLDFVYRRLPWFGQALADAASVLSLLVLAAFLAWKAWLTFLESWEFDSTSTTILQISLWKPQLMWSLGMSFFALCCAAVAVVLLVRATQRRRSGMRRIAGIPGVGE